MKSRASGSLPSKNDPKMMVSSILMEGYSQKQKPGSFALCRTMNKAGQANEQFSPARIGWSLSAAYIGGRRSDFRAMSTDVLDLGINKSALPRQQAAI